MVTFSLPGDNDVADGASAIPRSRPPLPFAKRAISASSPYGAGPGSAKRGGTPQSSRKLLMTRDTMPSSSLNKSSLATARNIFRASAISDSPPSAPFSPNLPQNTMKKLFVPSATPEPNRTFRDSTVNPTPRGMAAKTNDKELFSMRIASPPPELTGEALSSKVPKDWNSRGSIYADQFLAHLCPADFDEEQRRQFFCVLDLRRLKYAADEIFSKKDWRLNILNFAREFEKSRSIILLRYGLYEFQNVKPSKDVLKRWRREHGLPEPEEEEGQLTPSKSSAVKKRKAHDSANEGQSSLSGGGKRRAMEKEKEEAPVAAASNKNKRKASVSDESDQQPSKMSKPTSSASATLFGQIAEKHKASPAPSSAAPSKETPTSSKSGLLSAAKPTNGALARSVFSNIKPGPSQGSSSNIFGYLSDASSAKNSGVEADAESEGDSDGDDDQEAAQSDEPSVAASGGAETSSQTGSGLFGKQPAPTSGLATAASSTPGTRESTPGRSLFDRVTKNSEGHPARAETNDPPPTETPAITDQTWNPSSTPIKFAPSNVGKTGSFFNNTSSSGASLFAAQPPASSNLFGPATPKSEAPVEKTASTETSSNGADKTGGESDKENDSQAPNKPSFEPKSTPAQSGFGSSIFQTKSAPAETCKEPEPQKSAHSLFGNGTSTVAKPATSSAGNLFSAATKSTDASQSSTPITQSSTLFGNASSSAKSAETAASKPASLFGAPQSAAANASSGTSTPSLFGAKQPAAPANNMFGASSSTSQPLFGASTTAKSSELEKKESAPASTPAPVFSFSSSKPNDGLQGIAKPLFGAPKSPPTGTAGNSMFSGSPMKQDEPSPAKKAFAGGSGSGAAPIFGFGAQQNQPANNLFGQASNATSTTPAAAGLSFGSTTTNSASGSFNFDFNGANSGKAPSNPFSSNNAGQDKPAASTAPVAGGIFSFGATSAPSNSAPPSFAFGGGSNPTSGPQSGGSLFGGSASSGTPLFGGASASGGAPALNLTSASPQPAQSNSFTFGSNQPAPSFGNLQPPAGGASTTGTNSPFSLGGGSSLATTPAGGTPEPSAQAGSAKEGNEEEQKEEQVNLTEGLEADEEVMHEVRAKVLKFVPPEKSDNEDKPKTFSPWSLQGVGALRMLKHKETSTVRLLLRAEPRGHIALNRAVLPDVGYKSDAKYVRITTSNEKGDGLETWMLQVKTKESATALAEALEKNKTFNKK